MAHLVGVGIFPIDVKSDRSRLLPIVLKLTDGFFNTIVKKVLILKMTPGKRRKTFHN